MLLRQSTGGDSFGERKYEMMCDTQVAMRRKPDVLTGASGRDRGKRWTREGHQHADRA